MDDPAPTSDSGNSTPPPPNTSPVPTGEQKSVGLTSKHEGGTNPDERPAPKSAWERWQEHTLSDRVMAYFTGVVAVCAVIQIWILIGGSGQTDQLIRAAQISAHSAAHNAAAAQAFADSAESINRGISDAVSGLQAQARVAELARQTSNASSQRALQATIDDFRQDQRPYLFAFSMNPIAMEVGKQLMVNVSILNYGRSPALNVSTRGRVLHGIDALHQADDYFVSLPRFIDKKLQAPW